MILISELISSDKKTSNLLMWQKLGLQLSRTVQEQKCLRDNTQMHRERQIFDNSDLVRDAGTEKGDLTEI
jgi:hypothetical protein